MRNYATPVRVIARPTRAADIPTTWVRKTALPVLKAPSPVENSTDRVASRRDIGVGGIRRRRNSARCPEAVLLTTGQSAPTGQRCRPVFRLGSVDAEEAPG